MKKQLRILIADDHEIFREGLRAVLVVRPEWVVCAEADNGREAVAKAIELRPDVAVLDFSMPELNGVEAARRIRKAVPETEVLMLTMHNAERLAHEAMKAGVKGFVLKSDAKRDLVSAIEALNQHQAFFTAEISTFLLREHLEPEARPVAGDAPTERLTPREREILQLVAEGNTTKEIAERLGLSEKTIESHRGNLLRRLELHSAVDLVR
jgi:DNA-binding NarL/FixJ family response regulator